MLSFLTEIIGLTREQLQTPRNAPRGYNAMPIVSATMPREAQALAETDLNELAAAVRVPVLLVLGSASPPWAKEITEALAGVLSDRTLAVLDGQGHEAIDSAPAALAGALEAFLSQ
jgi:pimeloyl-ACP methyl ester carboxylesterase